MGDHWGGGCKEEKGEDGEGGERECRSLSRVHSLRAGEATTLATTTVVAHNISSFSSCKRSCELCIVRFPDVDRLWNQNSKIRVLA